MYVAKTCQHPFALAYSVLCCAFDEQELGWQKGRRVMRKHIRLGISRCLLGQAVRHDGGHKANAYAVHFLSDYFKLEGVCPEVESGMSIPRPTIHLIGDPRQPQLVEVINEEKDHTESVKTFSQGHMKKIAPLSGFILKNRSPTCGMERVKVYQTPPNQPKMGRGIFAKVLMDTYPLLPVEEEGRLNDYRLRENFIERIFVYYRWQNFLKKGVSAKRLLTFHTEHKLTLLAHDQMTYRVLGKKLANLKQKDLVSFQEDYIQAVMCAMQKMTTPKSHTNVLMHIQGYFKRELDKGDKTELKETIEAYRTGKLPLIVPIALLKHHLRRHPDPYLEKQRYLFPYPEELMLRNHI